MRKENRSRWILTGIVLMVLCVVCVDAAQAVVVNIPDPGLQAAIRLYSNKPTGDILDTDLAGLMGLSAQNAGITNLAGLEYCTNLQIVSFASLSILGPGNPNQISDISPLAGLTKLTVLQLDGNLITDISAVAGLTKLTALGLSSNQISDISPLAGLTNLTTLSLDSNDISDISALAGLTNLTTLGLSSIGISDISALAGLTNLTMLSLGTNQISDISAVAGLTNLTMLSLAFNQISDISALAGLTNLMGLYLNANQISDISALVANAGIDRGGIVDLSNNPLSQDALCNDIPTLDDRAVTVTHDGECGGGGATSFGCFNGSNAVKALRDKTGADILELVRDFVGVLRVF
jgi:hypothetical protein